MTPPGEGRLSSAGMAWAGRTLRGVPTSVPAPGHVVSFYDHDAGLATQVAAFLSPGLTRAGRAVVVATPEHSSAVCAELVRRGLPVAALARQGRLVVQDAATTLQGLLVDGRPDRGRVRKAAHELIGGAGSSTRVFGEMVALLCAMGAPQEAVRMEAWWDELARELGFPLMCAYPHAVLQGIDLPGLTRICAAHEVVRPPESYPDGTPTAADTAVFVPVPSAVAAARRFVSASLLTAGETRLLTDASLVVSEMATNAVRHAGSAFRVTVSRRGSAVRIGVEDVDAEPPRLRAASPEALGGRGVAIVEDVAGRWGWEATAEGKRVWAELRPA